MLGPHELLEKVMEFAQMEQDQHQIIIGKKKLWNHINKIDPKADIRNMYAIIAELDARGWLLENSDTKIEFDPVCF